MKFVPGGDNLVKGVQRYELFGGIALKIHTFSFSFSMSSFLGINLGLIINLNLSVFAVMSQVY